MAKRVTAPRNQKQPDWMQKKCGDYGHGVWVDSFNNVDWEGKPICLTCKYRPPYHILRGAQACANWKPKKEGEQ